MEEMKNNRTKVWMLILSVILSVISLVIYWGFIGIVPQFEEMFRDFGVALPLLTRCVLSYHQYFFLLAFLGVIPTAILIFKRSMQPKARKIHFGLVIISFGISLLMLVGVVVSMYLPIFTLGATS